MYIYIYVNIYIYVCVYMYIWNLRITKCSFPGAYHWMTLHASSMTEASDDIQSKLSSTVDVRSYALNKWDALKIAT